MRKVSRRRLAQTVVSLLSEGRVSRPQIMRMLAAYLVTHKQLGQLDLVLLDIAHELSARGDLLYAEVSSAYPLDAPTRSELQRYLKVTTGVDKVELHEQIDEALLAGVVVRSSDLELDTSARSKLRKLASLHNTPEEA
jgi:F-type H+-transporting ATPase subunit delta